MEIGDLANCTHAQNGQPLSQQKTTSKKVKFRKRKQCVEIEELNISKRRRMEETQITNGLKDEPNQNLSDDLSGNTNLQRRDFPRRLIGLMYQLDLSVLCSLRKLTYEHKYLSLLLEFGDSESDKFNNIVLRYKEKNIFIQVAYVDEYEDKSNFSLNWYFNSFVSHLISTTLDNIEYLVFYTNSDLDFTEIKLQDLIDPLKFDSLNIKELDLLKDFLVTKDKKQGRGFYHLLRDETTKKEIFRHLAVSPILKKKIHLCKFTQKEIKEKFLEKLIFAVNQPNRKVLNKLIKNEIEENSKVEDGYMELQEKILRKLSAIKYRGKFDDVSVIIYELNLLMLFMHDVFCDKNKISLGFDSKVKNMCNKIIVDYGKITFVKDHTVDSNINYSHLFTCKKQEQLSLFNQYFNLFIEKLEMDLQYFIILSDVGIDLTEKKTFNQGESEDFHPVKFESIDNQKKYRIIKNFSCMKKDGLYRIAKEKNTKTELSHLLKLPRSLQKKIEAGLLSDEYEKEVKDKFLDKLIIAVNQPDKEELSRIIKNKVQENGRSNKVPYNNEELREMALRWSESPKFGPITKEIMKELCKGLANNKSICKKNETVSINEAIKFVKTVVGKEGTPVFDQFLEFLMEEKKLAHLNSKGINIHKMSSILNRAGTRAIQAFQNLYDLWIDEGGNKTQYLKTLEEKGISLDIMCSMLHRAGRNAAKAFKELFDLWFDEEGKKTQYLSTLEEKRVNLASISSILSGGRAKTPKAFKDLYALWFDEEGNKSQYLETLEKEGINLANLSSILNGAGSKAAKAFKELYDTLFDVQGNKTTYLQTLEREGVNLSNMSSVLNGVGSNAAEAFKNLYFLWFDNQGNKTQYLNTLEREGINLTNMSSILSRSGTKAPEAFKNLYNIWFDEQGNKTRYLTTLGREGIDITNMSSISNGAGTNAARAYKELYDFLFDVEGNKTEYLKTLEKEGVRLANMASILHGARGNAVNIFKDLYDLWFDEQGNKTQYLITLNKEGINLTNISSILGGAGAKAPGAFKSLFDLWFDKNGHKTHYLKNLEIEGIKLSNMCTISHRSGANAAKSFKELYDLWFDVEGNKSHYLKTFEKEGVDLIMISSILNGAGANAAKALKELYSSFFDEQGNKKPHLEHFIEKESERSFTLHNLSAILNGSGIKAKHAFKNLHDICYDSKGEETELLCDFFDAGFMPPNLSSILCGAGVHASSALRKLHGVCFNNEREETELLTAFFEAGFRPSDLCRILSGAANSLEQLYEYCFVAETKKYLSSFLDAKCFTATELSGILHGARSNICPALKEFYEACFNNKGSISQVLQDFYKEGFTSKDLSHLLSMAGSNAGAMLIEFHRTCFNKKHRLNHFLTKKKLFKPCSLYRILHRGGINICPIFKKLHDICFDKTGNNTDYLNKLVEKNSSHEVLNILYKRVR